MASDKERADQLAAALRNLVAQIDVIADGQKPLVLHPSYLCGGIPHTDFDATRRFPAFEAARAAARTLLYRQSAA